MYILNLSPIFDCPQILPTKSHFSSPSLKCDYIIVCFVVAEDVAADPRPDVDRPRAPRRAGRDPEADTLLQDA